MKRKRPSSLLAIISIFILFCLPIFSQEQSFTMDRSKAKSKIILENQSLFSVLTSDNNTYGMYSLLQSYKDLAQSDPILFTKFRLLKKNSRTNTNNETIKIGGIHCTFDVPIKEEGKDLVDNFQTHTKTILSPLTIRKKGLSTSFYLDRNLFTNTTTNTITDIRADFGDTKGFRTILWNTLIPIQYAEEGTKTLQFIIHLQNGEEVAVQSTIRIKGQKGAGQKFAQTQQTISGAIIPNLSVYNNEPNQVGLGEYEIFLGADNVLDKPIIILDGFDPTDSRTIADIYDYFSFDGASGLQNLADRIREEENHDIVVLNFPEYLRLSDGSLLPMDQITDTNNDQIIDQEDYPVNSVLVDGGADYIERNASVFMALLDKINTDKAGEEPNVIIGGSMGGLISRYALNYMEQQNIVHDVRLWVSFDAPHMGANVPIGFQHLFNYLSYGLDTWVGDFSLESLKPIVDGMLGSPAAKQMLLDHMEAHFQAGSTYEFDPSITEVVSHPYKNIFYDRLANQTATGYPQLTRNISVVNGSGYGQYFKDKQGQDVLPGRKVLDAFFPDVAFLTDAYLDAWFTPDTNTTQVVSDLWIDAPWICFCDIEADASSQTSSSTAGLDTAMGGLFNLEELATEFAGADPLMDAFFDNLETDYFNFIPTISALGMENQEDWYAFPNPNNGEMVNESPFQAWYFPVENEDHITVTDTNATFIWDEIVQEPVLQVENSLLESIHILDNPFQETLHLQLDKKYTTLTLRLYDVLGKTVFQSEFKDVDNLLSVPLDGLSAGVYILKIQDGEAVFSQKVIKN